MRRQHGSIHGPQQLDAWARRVLKTPWIPVCARWTYSGERQRASLWDCLTALPLMAGYVRPTVQVIAICPERDEVLVLYYPFDGRPLERPPLTR